SVAGVSVSSNISTVTLPAAISRSATTVGLSFSQATVGSAPFARRRARCAASSTSWNRLSTFDRQSSTVLRAMAQYFKGGDAPRRTRKVVQCTRKGGGTHPRAATGLLFDDKSRA